MCICISSISTDLLLVDCYRPHRLIFICCVTTISISFWLVTSLTSYFLRLWRCWKILHLKEVFIRSCFINLCSQRLNESKLFVFFHLAQNGEWITKTRHIGISIGFQLNCYFKHQYQHRNSQTARHLNDEVWPLSLQLPKQKQNGIKVNYYCSWVALLCFQLYFSFTIQASGIKSEENMHWNLPQERQRGGSGGSNDTNTRHWN